MGSKRRTRKRFRQRKISMKLLCSQFPGIGKTGIRVAALAAALVSVCAIIFQISESGSKKSVYAAAGENVTVLENSLPTGLAGVISGVSATDVSEQPRNRIGTSFEEVMVGQRTYKGQMELENLDMSGNVEAVVEAMNDHSIEAAQNADLMSDVDYETLLQIVEAEAGGEDLKGKILVANVIMNRVRSCQFPDTITEVVWDTSGGVAQFSPTYDGRISTVTVSDETRKAVKDAMSGTDYSQGALFFVAKGQAEKRNVAWFESDLKHLFEYGVHDFYTYPDEEMARLDD